MIYDFHMHSVTVTMLFTLLTGKCEHGLLCNAAHGVHELRVNEAIQTGWLKPDFKTRFCDQWNAGDCPDGGEFPTLSMFVRTRSPHQVLRKYGLVCNRSYVDAEYCTHVHDSSELRRETAVSLGLLPENYKCGLCTYDACGTCGRGDMCNYAHGVADLR